MDKDDRYTRITLRIPRDLHELLAEAAEQTSKSMNAEIIARLIESFAPKTPTPVPANKDFAVVDERGPDIDGSPTYSKTTSMYPSPNHMMQYMVETQEKLDQLAEKLRAFTGDSAPPAKK
jgi:hypothetical protein